MRLLPRFVTSTAIDLCADVADADDVNATIDQTVREFGRGGQLITIVSVAGRVPADRGVPLLAYVASKHPTVGSSARWPSNSLSTASSRIA